MSSRAAAPSEAAAFPHSPHRADPSHPPTGCPPGHVSRQGSPDGTQNRYAARGRNAPAAAPHSAEARTSTNSLMPACSSSRGDAVAPGREEFVEEGLGARRQPTRAAAGDEVGGERLEQPTVTARVRGP